MFDTALHTDCITWHQRCMCLSASRLPQRKVMQRSASLQWCWPSRQPSSNSSWFQPISTHCLDHRHTSTWLTQMAHWPGELAGVNKTMKHKRGQAPGTWNLTPQSVRSCQHWSEKLKCLGRKRVLWRNGENKSDWYGNWIFQALTRYNEME